MPNKTVASYTQVPVTGSEILSVNYDRLPASQLSLLVIYEVKDSLGAVRATRTLQQTVALAAFPVSAATMVSAINAQEGT